eukprot:531385-Lingulodinium_polyedra.AAC.1
MDDGDYGHASDRRALASERSGGFMPFGKRRVRGPRWASPVGCSSMPTTLAAESEPGRIDLIHAMFRRTTRCSHALSRQSWRRQGSRWHSGRPR